MGSPTQRKTRTVVPCNSVYVYDQTMEAFRGLKTLVRGEDFRQVSRPV